ncbi:hypothetical protein [uncultured Stenotrophomonas sp.]|uniref:hypothetical protein n=1 Tax=uncultured Stenotrophomonas sp. TaxID=165438 RepID=UPI0025FED4E5|nr:hypothetical protein [uncultured Stenotrophomonas sp.]
MAVRQSLVPAVLLASLLLASPAGAETPPVARPSSDASATVPAPAAAEPPAEAPASATSANTASDPAASNATVAEAAPDDSTVADPATQVAAEDGSDTTLAEDDEDLAQDVPVSSKRIKIQPTFDQDKNGQPHGDRELRLVTREHTGQAAAGRIGMVAVSLLARGSFSGDANGFSKRGLEGDRIVTLPSPSFSIMPALIRKELDSYFAAHPEALPEGVTVLQVAAGEWSLIYQKLSDSQTQYELRHEASIRFPIVRKFLRSTGGEGVHCVTAPVAAPLANWQEDRYALVKATARQYAQQCVAQFAAQLPKLFPGTAADPKAAAPAAQP